MVEFDCVGVQGPYDLIIIEGWMVGFQSVDERLIEDEDMKLVNELLRDYSILH